MFVSMSMLIINSCAAVTPKKKIKQKKNTKYYKYCPKSWYLQHNPSELLSDQWEKHLKKKKKKTHTKSRHDQMFCNLFFL